MCKFLPSRVIVNFSVCFQLFSNSCFKTSHNFGAFSAKSILQKNVATLVFKNTHTYFNGTPNQKNLGDV